MADAFPEQFWVPDTETLAGVRPGVLIKTRIADLSTGDVDFWDSDIVWVGVEDVQDGHAHGVVVDSFLDALDEGVVIDVPFDRIFDVLPVGDDGDVGLNTARARFGLGKRALIGLTQVAPDGRIAQRQFVGTLSSVDPLAGIGFELADGGTFWLPPDGRALEEARPGTYTLRSTGETVDDPSYTCSWTVYLGAGDSEIMLR